MIDSTLKYLLGPVTFDSFKNEYYEKKHLLIKRKDREYYKDILTHNELDELLFSVNLFNPETRVVDNSKEKFPDPTTYTISNSKRIDALKFANYYKDGATLVFSGAHEKIYNLRKLANEIETVFKHPFQTNIYMTPSNSQGFSPHYDTHDVFILQFEGKKTWRIYDSNVKHADKTIAYEKGVSPVGNVVEEFVLEQGDFLYIPKGVMHDANCEDFNSGHITLGAVGRTWAELLANLMVNNSKKFEFLRTTPQFFNPLIKKENEVEQALSIIKEILEDEETKKNILDSFYSNQMCVNKGYLNNLIKEEKVKISDKVILKERNKIRIEHNENSIIDINFYDTKISFPQACEGIFTSLIQSNEPIQVQDLDKELEDESLMMVCNELFSNGLLAVE